MIFENHEIQQITIPWFDDFHPRQVGVVKKSGKAGKVQYRLRFKLPTGNECFPKAGTSQDEAKRFAKETQRRLIRQDWTDEERQKIISALGLDQKPKEERLTISASLKQFKKSVLRGLAESNAKNTESQLGMIESLFAVACANLEYVDELSPEAIEDLLTLYKQRTVKRHGKVSSIDDITVDNLLGLIRRWCAWLVDRDKLLKNPALRVKYLCNGGTKARKVIPEQETIRRVYEELAKEDHGHSSSWSPLRDIIAFLVESGCRKTEVLTMEWTDIKDGHFHIQEKTCADGFAFRPKSEKSHRSIEVSPEMQVILDRQPRVSSFVFPKAQVRISGDCPSKKESPSKVAKCCKCPLGRDRLSCDFRRVKYSRLRSIKGAWTEVRRRAGALHIWVHDLRRFHNEALRDHGLTNEESGALIGNSKEVNARHYDVHHHRRLQEEAQSKRRSIGRIGPKMEDPS